MTNVLTPKESKKSRISCKFKTQYFINKWEWDIIWSCNFQGVLLLLISFLAYVWLLLDVLCESYNCNKQWFDRLVLIAVLAQLLSSTLLLIKDLFWRRLWCVLLMVLSIYSSRNKWSVLIQIRRIRSALIYYLEYFCTFVLDIPVVQILF